MSGNEIEDKAFGRPDTQKPATDEQHIVNPVELFDMCSQKLITDEILNNLENAEYSNYWKAIEQRPYVEGRIFPGFAAIHYAAYFDDEKLFAKLFERQDVDIVTASVVPIKSPTLGEVLLPQDSTVLMIAVIAQSHNVITYLKTQFEKYGHRIFTKVNRDNQTALQYCALQYEQLQDLFKDQYFLKAEMQINASNEGLFFNICLYGQIKPLLELEALTRGEDQTMKELIYITLLKYQEKPYLTDVCERQIDYKKFFTTARTKGLMRQIIARLLQDAIDYAQCNQYKEFIELSEKWKFITIVYNDQSGLPSQIKQKSLKEGSLLDQHDILAEPEEKLKRWFSGIDAIETAKNILEFKGKQCKLEDEDYKQYQNLNLSQISLIRDNLEVFSVVYETELVDNVFCLEETVVTINGEEVKIPSRASVLQAAVLCQAQKVFLFLYSEVDSSYKLHVCGMNEETESLVTLAAARPRSTLAQRVIDNNHIFEAEFLYQMEASKVGKKNILEVSIQNNNKKYLSIIFQVANGSDVNKKEAVLKFALALGGPTAVAGSEKLAVEEQRLLRALDRRSVQYVQSNKLYENPEWVECLEKRFPGKGEEISKLWVQTEEDINEDLQVQRQVNFNLRVQTNIQDQVVNFRNLINAKKHQALMWRDAGTRKSREQLPKQDPFDYEISLDHMMNTNDLSEQVAEHLWVDIGDQSLNELLTDAVVSRPTNQLVDWLSACCGLLNGIDSVKILMRNYINAYDVRASKLEADEEQQLQTLTSLKEQQECLNVYNGFCGIHYAVLHKRWHTIIMLMDYELLNTTKAKVLFLTNSFGISQKHAVIPQGSNALQIALYAGHKDLFMALVDEILKQNKAKEVDYVQSAFGQEPVSGFDKLKIFQIKNELEHNVLATAAMCVTFIKDLKQHISAICCFMQNNEEQVLPLTRTQQLELQILIDQLDKRAGDYEKQKKQIRQKYIDENCSFSQVGQLLDMRIDIAVKNALVAQNACFLAYLRLELLSNPMKKIPDEIYAKLLAQIFKTVSSLNNDQTLDMSLDQHTRNELKYIQHLIVARYLQNSDEKIAGSQVSKIWKEAYKYIEPVQQFVTARNEYQQASQQLNQPQYLQPQETDKIEVFKRQKYVKRNNERAYLDEIIQSQDISCYFDAVIENDVEFVLLCKNQFVLYTDKRQTRGKIINGFSGLLYACYYGHSKIINYLLPLQYDMRGIFQQQQFLVPDPDNQYDYIFKNEVTFLQAAIVGHQYKIADQLFQLISNDAKLRTAVLPTKSIKHVISINPKKEVDVEIPCPSQDLLKLSLYNKCDAAFKQQLVINAEINQIYNDLLLDENQKSLLYIISEQFDCDSIEMLNGTVIRNPDHVMIAVMLTALQRLGKNEELKIDGVSALDLIQMNPNAQDGSADTSAIFTNFESVEQIQSKQLRSKKLVERITNSALVWCLMVEATRKRKADIKEKYEAAKSEIETLQKQEQKTDQQIKELQVKQSEFFKLETYYNRLVYYCTHVCKNIEILDMNTLNVQQQHLDLLENQKKKLNDLLSTQEVQENEQKKQDLEAEIQQLNEKIETLDSNCGAIEQAYDPDELDERITTIQQSECPLLFEKLMRRILIQYYKSEEELSKIQEQFEKDFDQYDFWKFVSDDSDASMKKVNYILQRGDLRFYDYNSYVKDVNSEAWFEACRAGSIAKLKELGTSQYIGTLDLRITHQRHQVYQGFTGLMYAILNNNIETIQALSNDQLKEFKQWNEARYNLRQEQIIEINDELHYLPVGTTPLHLAIIVAEQSIVDYLYATFLSQKIPTNHIPLSLSALAIQFNKILPVTQLQQDLLVDPVLVKVSVEFCRIHYFKTLSVIGQDLKFLKEYTTQLFGVYDTVNIPSEELCKLYKLTVFDIVTDLESKCLQAYQLTNNQQSHALLQQATDMKNAVNAEISRVLRYLIENHIIDKFSAHLNQFYNGTEVVKDIKSCYLYYYNPKIIDDSKKEEIQGNFLKMNPQTDLYEQTLSDNQFKFELSSVEEIQFFDACKMNDMQQVRIIRDQFLTKSSKEDNKGLLNSFDTLIDKRNTDISIKVHRGFTGLMYALVYHAYDVARFLLPFQAEIALSTNTYFDNFYLPIDTTIMHLAVLLNNEAAYNVVFGVNSSSKIWFASNQLKLTPMQLMVGQNKFKMPIFTLFLNRVSKFELLRCLTIMSQVDNVVFANQVYKYLESSVIFKEIVYEYVFDLVKVKQQKEDDKMCNADEFLLRLADSALLYALTNIEQPNTQWEACLLNIYEGDCEAKIADYKRLQQWNRNYSVIVPIPDKTKDADSQKKIDDATLQHFKIALQKNVILPEDYQVEDEEKAVKLGAKGCLRIPPTFHPTRLTEEQIQWFEDCKVGSGTEVVERIMKNLQQYAGLCDDREYNSVQLKTDKEGWEHKIVLKHFTGLMYAAYFGNLEIFKLLLPYEHSILTKSPNAVHLNKNGEENQKMYILEPKQHAFTIALLRGHYNILQTVCQLKDQPIYSDIYSSIGLAQNIRACILGNLVVPYDQIEAFIQLCSAKNNIVYEAILLNGEQFLGQLIQFCQIQPSKSDSITFLMLNCLGIAREISEIVDDIIYREEKEYLRSCNESGQEPDKHIIAQFKELYTKLNVTEKLVWVMGDQEKQLKFLTYPQTKASKLTTKTDIDSKMLVMKINMLAKVYHAQRVERTNAYRLWKELSLKYAIARNDTKLWSELLNLNCEDQATAEQEIAEFKLDQMNTPLMSVHLLQEVMQYGYVIGDNLMDKIDQEQSGDKTYKNQSQQSEELTIWFEAIKQHKLSTIRLQIGNCVGQRDQRESNIQDHTYTGFSAIHYAAYFGHVDVLLMLWPHEKHLLTDQDAIVDSIGIRFGSRFLLSAGSNILMIAVLQAREDILMNVCQLLDADSQLADLYKKPNKHGVTNLYTAAICWRTEAGKVLLGSQIVQQELMTANYDSNSNKLKAITPIHAVMLSGSIYLGQFIHELSVQENSYKLQLFKLIMQTDMDYLVPGQQLRESELKYVGFWRDLIYTEALNYTIANRHLIDQEQLLEAKFAPDIIKALQNQYNKNSTVYVVNGYIQVEADNNSLAKVLPKIGQKEQVRQQQEMQWLMLNQMVWKHQYGEFDETQPDTND